METIPNNNKRDKRQDCMCEHEEVPATRLLQQYVVDGKLVAEWIDVEDIFKQNKNAKNYGYKSRITKERF